MKTKQKTGQGVVGRRVRAPRGEHGVWRVFSVYASPDGWITYVIESGKRRRVLLRENVRFMRGSYQVKRQPGEVVV